MKATKELWHIDDMQIILQISLPREKEFVIL